MIQYLGCIVRFAIQRVMDQDTIPLVAETRRLSHRSMLNAKRTDARRVSGNNIFHYVNMRILTFLTFVVAIAIMIGMDIFLFSEDVLYGIGGIIGILGFFIAYSISGDMIIAPRDYWRLSSWQVFRKKFGYGMGAYVMITFIASGVLAAIFN